MISPHLISLNRILPHLTSAFKFVKKKTWYLGTILDNKLSWKSHIAKLTTQLPKSSCGIILVELQIRKLNNVNNHVGRHITMHWQRICTKVVGVDFMGVSRYFLKGDTMRHFKNSSRAGQKAVKFVISHPILKKQRFYGL